ncbi:MAG: Gfo/Idh/MocA family protein [Anaerolineae bacterium]
MAVRRRVVVVGVGSIGRRHARLLCEREDVAVELCEPSEDALAQARADIGMLPGHPSFEAALASKPYAVVIATPVECHRAQTIAALRDGIHVLCEKPMSATMAEAVAMKEATAASSAVLSVGFMLHFHPGLLRLRRLIDDGAFGTVLQVQYRTGSYITLVNSRSRYQATLEGALLMDYAHQPDAIHYLLRQRPKGVYMAARQAGQLEFTSNPNYLTMVCDYESPLLSTIELNYVQMPQRHEIEIIGDAGWAAFDFEAGMLRIARRADQSITPEGISVVRDDLYREEHRAFLDAAAGKRAPSSPAAEAIISMEVIDAALASWKSGRRVELG